MPLSIEFGLAGPPYSKRSEYRELSTGLNRTIREVLLKAMFWTSKVEPGLAATSAAVTCTPIVKTWAPAFTPVMPGFVLTAITTKEMAWAEVAIARMTAMARNALNFTVRSPS